MPFGAVSGVGRGMDVLDGMVIVEGEEAALGGEFGASHCKQWVLCDALFSYYFEDLLSDDVELSSVADPVFRLLTWMLFSRRHHQGAVEGPANGRGRNGQVPVQSEKPEELPDLVVPERRRDQSAKRQVRNFFLFSVISFGVYRPL